MEPLVRANLAENAVEAIRAEIVANRWVLGERLPNEATLSAMLSVSRGTVREAVRMLVAKGYLETRQGSGTYVRSAVDPVETLLRAKRAGLRDLFEARCALDVEAARLAALRHSPSVIADLQALLAERGNSAETDHAVFVARDLAFHKAVIAASGNCAMIELYAFFSASIQETIEATLGDGIPEPDIAAHAAIIDAIATGNPDKADAAVRGFMSPVLATLDEMLRP